MAEFGNLPTIEPVVEKLDGKMVVTLGTVHFTEGNAAVRAALEDADVVELRETFAQRYLGCGMPAGKRLEIHGVPGNDMACYMDGGDPWRLDIPAPSPAGKSRSGPTDSLPVPGGLENGNMP